MIGTTSTLRYSPSKSRRGSFSSSVSSSRAAFRILARVNLTRHTSRLLRRPYSPIIFSSWSRRSFSKGRRGVVYVLRHTSGTRGISGDSRYLQREKLTVSQRLHYKSHSDKGYKFCHSAYWQGHHSSSSH